MPDATPAAVVPAVSAPSTPAPSPSPSAAPSPSSSSPPAAPANAPAAGTTVMDSFDKQFTDLDESPKPAAAPAPAPAPAPAAATAPKPDETPAPTAAPVEEGFESPQVATMKEVRGWGRRMADMAKNAISKNKELATKLQELEARGAVPPDVAKIQEDYQRLQKQVADYQQRVARTDYSQSKEYEEKYKQPYQQAYLRGRSATQALTVRETDADGNVTPRPGTPADFDRLYEMSDSDADAASEAMFGPSARRVIGLRDQAKERAESAYNAIQENTAKFSQERQAGQAQLAQRRLALQGLWKKVNDDLHSKHAQWFAEREGDNEWNQALAKGREIVQQRFGPAYAQLSPEQRVVLDAQVFNRAAAFTPMRTAISKLESKLTEANKTIEQLRGSGPGKPAAGTAPADGGEAKSWAEAFEKQV